MRKVYFITNFVYILTIVFSSFSNIKAQPFGGFIRFDGIDDELTASASSLFQSNSDFTIEFWFRTCQDTLLTNEAFLGNSKNIGINMFPSFNSNVIFYQLCANTTNNVWSCHQDHQYPSNLQWHHVAVTYYHLADEFEFYFDGIDGTTSTSDNYDFSAVGPFYVGRSGYQAWLYKHFNGYMDELRISSTVRYNGSFTPQKNEFILDANTRGLWHFNETNPVLSVLDYSGNNIHLSATGNPITINLDSLITQTNNTLIVVDSFDSYQWIECENGLPYSIISGETSQSFVPPFNGSYAVEINQKSCSLRSNCYDIEIITGLVEPSSNLGLMIYPNPSFDMLHIKSNFNITNVEILDLSGRRIQLFNKVVNIIDVSGISSGIYFIKIVGTKKNITKKLVIQ